MKRNKIKSFLFVAFATLIGFTSCNKDEDSSPIVETDNVITGSITNDTTWKDTVYFKGFVYVKAGATLTINEGTIIKAVPGYSTTLIIERDAKINAIGSASKPIVFTPNMPAGGRRAGDWGGIIICGRADINLTGKEGTVEGGTGAKYGPGTGTVKNDDNSGTLKYVRIEYAGFPLEPNKEINSLTLAGVGSGTTVEYIQVSYANDDSYEMFGGTVNLKYIIAYKGVDDDFDTDNGYRGNVQYGIAIRDKVIADVAGDSNGFESDNDEKGSTNTPVTKPVFSNMTFIGPMDSINQSGISSSHNSGMRIRRNSKLSVHNSVFAGWVKGILLESSGTLSSAKSVAGDSVRIANCLFLANKDSVATPGGADYVTLWSTQTINNLKSVKRLKDAFNGNFRQAPALNSNYSSLVAPDFTGNNVNGAFFDKVNFIGAIGATDWTTGWTNWDPQSTTY
jgi:hypothetical protein